MYSKIISSKELSDIVIEIQDGIENTKPLINYIKIFNNEIQQNKIFINFKDIDTLKNFSIKIREIAKKENWDISRNVGDFIFSIEKDYQSYYGLEEDNYDLHDKAHSHEYSL
jgi:hypothetical protein